MNKRLYFLIAAFTITAFGMVSCKKDQNVLANAGAGSKDAVGFGISNSDYIFLDIPGGLTSLDTSINVFLSGNTYGSDITVTLTPNTDLVTAYNDANGSGYLDMPSDTYTLPLTVTIPANSKKGSAKLSIDLNKLLTYGIQFGLGYTVSSVQGGPGVIMNEHKDLLIIANVRNAYDGVYSIESGTVTRYTAPGSPANDALSGDVTGNPDLELSTIGPNTVEIAGLSWVGGGGVGGVDNLRATVDPSTNEVTMSALGNATLANWAGHDNYYDPATQTFHLAFLWNPTSTVRTYEMVIHYSSSR